MLDGPKPAVSYNSIAVRTAAQGRQAVNSLKRQRADLVKVYIFLPREAYLAIADEARKQGLPFAGHVPFAVSAAEASDARQSSIEHFDIGLMLACSDRERLVSTTSPTLIRLAEQVAESCQRRGSTVSIFTLWKYLTAENIAVALAMVGTCLFSVLAACAQMQLWKKTRHIEPRRRQQQFITEGIARLR